MGFTGSNGINNLIVVLIIFSACKCLYENFLCVEVVVTVVVVDVYGSRYILFYCSNYIILLYYLYYFIVLKDKINLLILNVLYNE